MPNSYSRRLLLGGVLAGTTSIGTRRLAPGSAQAAGGDGNRLTKVPAKQRRVDMSAPGKAVRVGVIGTGVAGAEYVQRLLSRGRATQEVAVGAVCDVYEPNRRHATAIAELEAKDAYVNYRDLLARTDINAVVIATPSHWHARMAVDAMSAGKDVYLEPPLALTLEEARQVHHAVSKYKRVLQVATPQAADPRFVLAGELIGAGEIGQVLWAQATDSSNSVEGGWNAYVDEDLSTDTLNWDLWLGPAVHRPFSAERFTRWRKYWDYSGGIAMEVFFPKMTQLLTALGRQMPQRVTASGGIFIHKDREVPDTFSMQAEYPNFYLNLAASTATAAPNRFLGDVIYGSRGTITIQEDLVQVHSEPVWDSKLPESKRGLHQFRVQKPDLAEEHISNFLEGVRARRQPLLDTAFALEIMTPLVMAVDSYRLGLTRHYDTHANHVTDRAAPRLGYEGNGRNHPDTKKRRV